MKIGYLSNNYPEKRCIIDKIKQGSYYKISAFNDKTALTFKVLKKMNFPLPINIKTRGEFIFKSQKNFDVDIVHTFNTVCKIKTPWLSTFETTIPRMYKTMEYHHENSIIDVNQRLKNTFRLLGEKYCRRLIALSDCNYNIQQSILQEVIPDIAKEIMNKTIVLPPPQITLSNKKDIEKKYNDYSKEIRFIFIGRDFFRKGGKEALNVLCELRKNYNIKFTIISSINYGDYATHTTKNDKNRVIELIKKNKDWITWFKSLRNEEVLKLCNNSHVGILSTWADTYGYSILEMQANGCPVITTNIRAIPEINNNNCGWVCEVPKNQYGEGLYSNDLSRKNMSSMIMQKLRTHIINICNNRNLVYKKAVSALSRIEKEHSPQKYSSMLYQIYQDSI